ncbi:MlaD family protein [Endozoicomonas gorgoniicola]|uniref:MlaD family protein n=1 Tax=Endozoicomonas gorgoniicola TaxID=1234144 RepID=A0ABT3MQP8_9GAMM|nr:MlaD family protein [Endozoicomonas gorgoniicola]MCW7551694.1 MlaD family protein [Endozoicomonas gorgoniicola]
MSRTANKRSLGTASRPIMVGIFMLAMAALVTALIVFVNQGNFSGRNKERMVVIYDTSIMGLNIGAAVTLRGVKIGEVADIKAKLYDDSHLVLNTVYVDIYPDTIVSSDETTELNLDELYHRGLGVKLKTQSLLTGLLYMEVDFYQKTQPRFTDVKTRYPQIPTVPSDLESLTEQLHDMNLPELMNDLGQLAKNLKEVTDTEAFRQLPGTVNDAMYSFRIMSTKMGTSMSDMRNEFVGMAQGMEKMSRTIADGFPQTNANINRMLETLTQTLDSMNETIELLSDTVAPDSPLIYQLERSATDLRSSARAMQGLAELLEEQPNALVSGKSQER